GGQPLGPKDVEEAANDGHARARGRHFHRLAGLDEATLHVDDEQGGASGLEGEHALEGRRAVSAHARSAWPRLLPGATASRTSCLSSRTSGKRPRSWRDHSRAPSTRTSKTPPAPGTSATSPISA